MKWKGIARLFAGVRLLLAACVECVHAQAQDPLIVRMAANENALLANIGKDAPLVETYLQIVSKGGETPVADRYSCIESTLAVRSGKHCTISQNAATRSRQPFGISQVCRFAMLPWHSITPDSLICCLRISGDSTPRNSESAIFTVSLSAV